ncbi:MAG: hypothetical protein WD824_10405 [Cyclobacteriaceae bacterium]
MSKVKDQYKLMKKMRIVAFSCVVGFAIFLGCDREESHPSLYANDTLAFSGYFRTINSDENLLGEVNLSIVRGSYQCTTYLPNDYGAGRLSLEGNNIAFTDTVLRIRFPPYGPSYILSGEYYYEFDGKSLWIAKKKNIGEIEYLLELVE